MSILFFALLIFDYLGLFIVTGTSIINNSWIL